MARPKKDPAELRVDLRMRVPPDLKSAIETAASSAGMSITAWVEQAVSEKLKADSSR